MSKPQVMFRVGEQVLCVEPVLSLVAGKVYTVLWTNGRHIRVDCSLVDCCDYLASHFDRTTDTNGDGMTNTTAPRCRGCPHPPHLGLCTRRSGQTAWACGCSECTPMTTVTNTGGTP